MKLPAHAGLRQYAPCLLVLIGAAFAVGSYLQALHFPFVSDDISYVVTNKALADLQWSELWRLLFKPYNIGFEFLPLRDLSYWLDIALFGQEPAGFRLHNILLYLLCLPLLYAVTAGLWRYFRPADASSAPWVAAVVTALFAVHPALVESVVWISGRKYILPDFFSLLSLWFAVQVRSGQGFSSRYATATLVAFVGVMFSKSSYVGVAPIIAMLWLRFWLDIPSSGRRRVLLLWPAAILLLAATLLLAFIIDNQGFDTIPAYFGIEAVYRSLAILGGLTRISLTPGARHYFYPVFEDPWFPAMIALGLGMLVATAWGVMVFLRRRSFAGFILLLFLLFCLPYLQLVPAKPPSLVADRYVALAIWPAIMMVVFLAWQLKFLLRVLVVLAFALPWIYQTVERPRDWRDFERVVAADLRSYPGYYMPAFYTIINVQMHNGLYREANSTASLLVPEEIRDVMVSLVRADRVLRIDAISSGKPDEAMYLLGELSRRLERRPEQARWNAPMLFIWLKFRLTVANEWQYLAENFPDNAFVRYNAGVYLFNMHEYRKAEVHLRAAAGSQALPESSRSNTYMNLGIIYAKTGRSSEAITMLQAALVQPAPNMRAYCLLADVYEQIGRREEAAHAAAQCPGHNPALPYGQ